ncbi:MAG: UDP-2,4-diacetamido-2,4,6-trideoxy-beta-L-altropyranose hydrolase [Candidatus Cloacimonetes bacterium]|nr:UDP-2,4-diacetamido-2,4,6-trideoxy-beta-L-altropyranose hydrolase [Candidatus Cloacimonadota bacterium]
MGSKLKVVILTEGGKNIGFGHITRCTSIYQAFEEKGVIPEFIVNGDYSILDLISDKNNKIFNWIEQKEYLFDYIKNADIVIIDSYLAPKEIYTKISDLVKVPVYFDDNKRLNYPKGIIINGAIYAQELDYPQNNGITYLLGTKYTPLRKEFWNVPAKNIRGKVESVMVTFGGDDMSNMTPKVLKLLVKKFPELKKNVIIGRSFKNIEDIEKLKDKKTKFYYDANAETMKEIMLESDIAISAAGQTTYELARIGTPSIVISIAKNQIDNVKGWLKSEFIEYAGWWENESIINKIKNCLEKITSFNTREEKKLKGEFYIDGKGSIKIVSKIINTVIG